MKVSLQVANALRALHPGVRKDIRRALDDLDAGIRRDVCPLEGELAGFFRLRVGKYRIIFRVEMSGTIMAEFLETRDAVYARFKPKD